MLRAAFCMLHDVLCSGPPPLLLVRVAGAEFKIVHYSLEVIISLDDGIKKRRPSVSSECGRTVVE